MSILQRTKSLFWEKTPEPVLEDLDLGLEPEPEPPKEVVSLDKIYEEHGIVSAPFPAEKLLAVLEKLPDMPIQAQRATLTALSATKDWTFESIAQDATLKVTAITNAIQQYNASHEAIDRLKRENIDKENNYLSEATKTIHDQIVELQKRLEAEAIQVKDNIKKYTEDANKDSNSVNEKISELQQQASKFNRLLLVLEEPNVEQK